MKSSVNFLHAGNLDLGYSRAALRGISLTARVRYACRGARPHGGFSLLRKYRRVGAAWIGRRVFVCCNVVLCMFCCSISRAIFFFYTGNAARPSPEAGSRASACHAARTSWRRQEQSGDAEMHEKYFSLSKI